MSDEENNTITTSSKNNNDGEDETIQKGNEEGDPNSSSFSTVSSNKDTAPSKAPARSTSTLAPSHNNGMMISSDVIDGTYAATDNSSSTPTRSESQASDSKRYATGRNRRRQRNSRNKIDSTGGNEDQEEQNVQHQEDPPRNESTDNRRDWKVRAGTTAGATTKLSASNNSNSNSDDTPTRRSRTNWKARASESSSISTTATTARSSSVIKDRRKSSRRSQTTVTNEDDIIHNNDSNYDGDGSGFYSEGDFPGAYFVNGGCSGADNGDEALNDPDIEEDGGGVDTSSMVVVDNTKDIDDEEGGTSNMGQNGIEPTNNQNSVTYTAVAAEDYEKEIQARVQARVEGRIVTASVIVDSENVVNTNDRHKAVSSEEIRHSEWYCLSILSLFGCGIVAIAISLGLVFSYDAVLPSNATPSSAPSSPQTAATFDTFLHLVSKVSDNATLYDTSSPQFHTLEWLVNDFETSAKSSDYWDTPKLIEQRYVIALLYISTIGGGPYSTTTAAKAANVTCNDLNFLTTKSVCEWSSLPMVATSNDTNNYLGGSPSEPTSDGPIQGIQCDDELKFVKTIRLENLGLNGTLPSELSNILSLEELIIAGNVDLRGSIPTEFGLLRNLRSLQIWGTGLSGRIPTQLGALRKIKSITIVNNFITGSIPSGLFYMSNLNLLHLGENLLSGSLPELPVGPTNLQELFYFDIGSNLLEGSLPMGLYDIPNLEFILFADNEFDGSISTNIGNLKNLNHLDVSVNHISGSLPTELGLLDDLSILFMNSNTLVGPIPSELGQLDRLEMMRFDSNKLSGTLPPSFTFMQSLLYLELGNNTLSHDAMGHFCNYTLGQVRVGSDCFGDSPMVDCPCCASCYDKDSDDFVVNIPGICATEADTLELFGLQEGRGSVCVCGGDGVGSTALSCFESCQSCNLDQTVCAITADYTRRYTEEGFYQSETTTFQYVKGRNDTVVFQSNWNEAEYCKVLVNGQKCRECRFYGCRDDFIAFGVLCDNLEGVGNYSPCDQNDDDDALAVFSFQDQLLVQGCAPWFPRF